MNVAWRCCRADPFGRLRVRKIEALADGIMDAGLVSVREQARPAAQQSEVMNCYASGRKLTVVWMC